MKKFDSLLIAAENAIANQGAETYVDTGVKILIAVVVGAMLLAGLVNMFDKTILPQATQKVKDIFSKTVTYPSTSYDGTAS